MDEVEVDVDERGGTRILDDKVVIPDFFYDRTWFHITFKFIAHCGAEAPRKRSRNSASFWL